MIDEPKLKRQACHVLQYSCFYAKSPEFPCVHRHSLHTFHDKVSDVDCTDRAPLMKTNIGALHKQAMKCLN